MTRENTIDLVLPEEATEKTAAIYEEIAAAREGELDNDLALSKLWLMFGSDPELLEVVWEHTDLMYNRGDIPFELKSKISLVVASVTDCEGCRFFHESALEREGADDEIKRMKQLEIVESAFTAKEYEVLRFAEKAAADPHSITDDDLQALKDAGFTGKRLLEVLDCIAFHVYTATLQAMAGIVYEGMSREEWTSLDDLNTERSKADETRPTVTLFKTADCGRCPQVQRRLEDIANERDVEIQIIDIGESPQKAAEHGVLSVPTVVVDGRSTLNGVPSRDELLTAIEKAM